MKRNQAAMKKPLVGSNPFATKFIRAGAIPFHFESSDSLEQVRDRLQEANWRGQIVGPHGSGKTTLLRTLDPFWREWGRAVITHSLRNGQRRLAPANCEARGSDVDRLGHQIVVDGYEQLSFLSKCALLIRCRVRRLGLLVTTHRRCRWLPVVLETRPSVRLAEELVKELIGADPTPSAVSLQQIQRCYDRNNGNLRETFLSLYDSWGRQPQNSDDQR